MAPPRRVGPARPPAEPLSDRGSGQHLESYKGHHKGIRSVARRATEDVTGREDDVSETAGAGAPRERSWADDGRERAAGSAAGSGVGSAEVGVDARLSKNPPPRRTCDPLSGRGFSVLADTAGRAGCCQVRGGPVGSQTTRSGASSSLLSASMMRPALGAAVA
jgi:hypothetical protein